MNSAPSDRHRRNRHGNYHGYRQNRYRSHYPHITGHGWEIKVFGISSRQFPKPEYTFYKPAKDWVIDNQTRLGWNPFKPRTKYGSEILACVRSYFPPHIAKRIGFYCSIGTVLDHYHKVDGFFKIDNHCVTVDLCTYLKPSHMVKADILFVYRGTRLWRSCIQIANELKRKMGTDCP